MNYKEMIEEINNYYKDKNNHVGNNKNRIGFSEIFGRYIERKDISSLNKLIKLGFIKCYYSITDDDHNHIKELIYDINKMKRVHIYICQKGRENAEQLKINRQYQYEYRKHINIGIIAIIFTLILSYLK